MGSIRGWLYLYAQVMTETVRSVVLKHWIDGAPSPNDFEIVETPKPSLADGQALFRTHFASVDPGTRSRLSPGASYAAPLNPGDTVDGFCVGEVVESQNDKLPVGSLWAYGGGWSDHFHLTGRGFLQPIPRTDLPLSLWIGILGVPGMTAYFGLKRLAQIRDGDRALITSAAGPVGATAGQLAKHFGASSVVGVAGGPKKCAWVKDVAGFDDCLDYKGEADLDAALGAALPKGVDILFDNVGNAMIDRVLPRMRPGGRIVISGQVADYNLSHDQVPGIKNTREFIAKRLRMEGIVVFDDLKAFPQAQAEVASLIAADTLAYREERFEGLSALPEAFCGLFTGESFGRRIVSLA